MKMIKVFKSLLITKRHIALTMVGLMMSSVHMLSAQTLKFGLGRTTMNVNSSSFESSAGLIRPEIGVAFNAGNLNDNISVHTEVLLSWRGMNYSYYQVIDNYYTTLDYIVDTKYKVKLTYLEMPVIFSTDAGPVNLEFGPSLGLQMGGKRVGETTITKDYTTLDDEIVTFSEDGNYANKKIFPKGVEAKRPVSWVDFGFNVGGKYGISESMFIYGRYYYGVIDVFRRNYPVSNASVDRNNHSSIRIGVGMLLGD